MWVRQEDGNKDLVDMWLLDMPDVRVDHAGYSSKQPKRLFDIRGLPSRGVLWTHGNTVANIVHSLHERVYGRTAAGTWAPTLLPERGAFSSAGLLAFQRGVSRELGSHSLPGSVDSFLGHYRGQKRRRYEAAARSLESKPICRSDSYPGVFLKAEKWLDWKAGRLISARTPRYNLEVGRYLLFIEKRVYVAIDTVWGSPCIMKGYTQERRAAVAYGHWNSFEDPVAVGLDYSKFDQHISRDALATFEHPIYLRAYGGDQHLQRLLSWQLDTTCYARAVDGVVKYKVRGGRMSGDMNTAMGNCLISSGLLYGYCYETGVKARAMVDGDDAVVFMERADLARFMEGVAAWMRKRGFHLTIEEPVYELSGVEFCQCKYVATTPPTMVRNPFKAIAQDHAWVEDKQISWAEVLAATGLGGLALYGNIPVLGAYYDMLARTTEPSRKTLQRLDFRSSWLRDATFDGVYSAPSERARYEFWRTWGMSPGEQRAHEANFLATHLGPIICRDTKYHKEEHTNTEPKASYPLVIS